jgi:hypothetical protein
MNKMDTLENIEQTYEIKRPEMVDCLHDLLSRMCNGLKEDDGIRRYHFHRNGVIEVREKEVYISNMIDTGIKSVVGNLIGAEIR